MMDADARSVLAARTFPKLWARWGRSPGRTASRWRNKLRNWAEQQVRLDAMRGEGRCCANCASYRTPSAPLHPSEPWCAADSDHAGYTLVRPGHLCLLHQWREARR